jgi:soluble calcium-activated nucleotidase 1
LLFLNFRDIAGEYSTTFLDEVPLVSRLSEADRGMELSELVYFHDKLLTFSDRTGVIYEVTDGGKLVPLWILSDHDGQSEDGFKCEWATVKDDVL